MKQARPAIGMQVSQGQVMTQQLLQSIRLLQLSTQELKMELRQALDSNLLLEAEEVESQQADPDDRPGEGGTADDERLVEVSGQDVAAMDRVEADFDWSSRESWSGGEPLDEDGEPASARIADTPSDDPRLQALAQLQLIVRDARQAELVAALVDAVDDNGYLGQSLETILAGLPAGAGYAMGELVEALRLVQSVEPTGFAARDLAECLSLQLQMLPPSTPGRPVALAIVGGYLQALGSLTEQALAESVGYRVEQVRTALALIKSLDPKPGAAMAAPAQAVVPEVIVTGGRGGWRVELNPETLPRVRINRSYEKMVKGVGSGQYKALRDQLNEARWLVRGLEMRHDTLLKTARVVFERQSGFLRSGEEAMAPLNLKDVAEAIGMHESTICRVIANKYALTPWGVYPLKAFFPVQIAGREGDTCGTAVRAMIRRIVDGENRERPLSDGDIAALLARRGVRVARRTVAKYREAMRIPPAPARVQVLRQVAG